MPVGGNSRLGKSPNSFDSFEKDSSFGSDGTMQEGARQLRRTSRTKRLIVSNLSLFSERWISITHKVIASLTLPWPSPRPPPLGILETILSRVPNPKPCWLGILETSHPKKFKLRPSPHTPRTYIPRVTRIARPPTRKLGRRRRDNVT